MKTRFYCKDCKKCNKYYEILTECMAKVLLSFNKQVKNWEVMHKEKNKHFKIKPKD